MHNLLGPLELVVAKFFCPLHLLPLFEVWIRYLLNQALLTGDWIIIPIIYDLVWHLFTPSFSSLSLGLKKQTLCEESLWYKPLVEVNQAILAWSIRQSEIWSQAYTVSQTKNKHKEFTQSSTSEKCLNNILLHDWVWQIFTLSLSSLSSGLKKQVLCEWSLWYTPLVEVNQAILAWSIRHRGKQSHALSMKFINLCLSG